MIASYRIDPNLGSQKVFVQLLKGSAYESRRHVIGELDKEGEYATKLQSAWRRRIAYTLAKDLKQQKLCKVRREEIKSGMNVECEACASAGKNSSDIRARFQKKAWKQTDELLFKGKSRVQVIDRGDNWNERWQEALALPNKTDFDKNVRNTSLEAVYSDFVHTAVTYGRTIISEYFLHEYMKSVRPKQLGGVAGGKKYLWRGILFKLADGSQGPYGGSDEAAAKAAGHELRGGSQYLRIGEGLCVPPMCLLDYKGFRMLAQAHVPVGGNTFKMGTPDGGKTVRNESLSLNKAAKDAAKKLRLRGHTVGGRLVWETYRDLKTGEFRKAKRNFGGYELYTAADVEGHEGYDSRMYLLDLARAFPPEDPNATPHLSGMLSVSAKVIVRKEGEKDALATVTRAHSTLVDYDVLYPTGELCEGTPAHLLRDLRLFIFYRLLRPEFVRDRGAKLLRAINLPRGYKFHTIVVTNPMMFAIKFGSSNSAGAGTKKTAIESEQEERDKAGSSSSRYSTGSKSRSNLSVARGQMNVLETVEECNSIAPPESREAVLSGTEYTSFHSLHEGADETRECGEEEDGQPSLPPTSASHYAIGFGEITPENMDGFGADGQENVVIEEWKRKAMECGIEFVESGDKYYEGFRRSELEDDEEELKIRGGVGYRPFVPGTTPREEDYADPDDIENDGYDPVFCCDGKMQIGKGNEVSRIGCDSKTFSGKGCLANSFGEHHKLSASRSPSTSDNRRVVGASSAHVSVAVNDGSTTGDEGSSAEVPNRSDFTNCTHTSAEEKRRFERRETSMDSTCTVPPSTHTSQSGAATTFPNNEKDSDEGDCDHHQNGREHLTYQQQQGTVSSTKTRVFDGKQGKWDGGDDLQFSSSMEDSSIGDPEGEEVAGEQEQEFGHENQTQRPVKGGEDDDDDDDQDSLRGSLARLPGGAGDNYGGFETESWSSLMSSAVTPFGQRSLSSKGYESLWSNITGGDSLSQSRQSSGRNFGTNPSRVEVRSIRKDRSYRIPSPIPSGRRPDHTGSRADAAMLPTADAGASAYDTFKPGAPSPLSRTSSGFTRADPNSIGEEFLNAGAAYDRFSAKSLASNGSIPSMVDSSKWRSDVGNGRVAGFRIASRPGVGSGNNGSLQGHGNDTATIATSVDIDARESAAPNTSVVTGSTSKECSGFTLPSPNAISNESSARTTENPQALNGEAEEWNDGESSIPSPESQAPTAPTPVAVPRDSVESDVLSAELGVAEVGVAGTANGYDKFVAVEDQLLSESATSVATPEEQSPGRNFGEPLGDGDQQEDLNDNLPPSPDMAMYSSFRPSSARSIRSERSSRSEPSQQETNRSPGQSPARDKTASPGTIPERRDRANVQSPTAREGTTRPVSSMSPPTSVVPLVKAIKTPVIQPEEKAYTGIAGRNPLPLSPDALTAFSNGDPDARERNREITEATQYLLTVLVPAAARLFCSMLPEEVAKIDLATELHKFGINMRHIGLLRAYISPPPLQNQNAWVTSSNPVFVSAPAAICVPVSSTSKDDRESWRERKWCESSGMVRYGGSPDRKDAPENKDTLRRSSSAGRSGDKKLRSESRYCKDGEYSSEAIMRDRVLVEVVVRTLKLVLREFQRRWMKSEQSTSEHGMHMLVAEFLNLVTGKHERKDKFWREDVTVGVCQRFGTVALTDSERTGLWRACSERPNMLFMIVDKLVNVTGVRFKESVYQRLRKRKPKVIEFEFTAADIKDIDPVVTPMAIFAY